MLKKKILLNSVDKVKEFVGVTSRMEEDMDICRDRYVVDAKSIMGIFSLDLSKPLELVIHTENEEAAKKLQQFFC